MLRPWQEPRLHPRRYAHPSESLDSAVGYSPTRGAQSDDRKAAGAARTATSGPKSPSDSTQAVRGHLVQLEKNEATPTAENSAITADGAPATTAASPCPEKTIPQAPTASTPMALPRQAPTASTGIISPPLNPPANVSKVSAPLSAKDHHGRTPPSTATAAKSAPGPQ